MRPSSLVACVLVLVASACSTPAVEGPAGKDGRSAVVRTLAEAPGTNCAAGGLRVQSGLDANANGALDDTEVDAASTQYVCNGAPGQTGPAGTFQGDFAGPATFGGAASFGGTTAFGGAATFGAAATFEGPVALDGAVTVNGKSLFDAVFAGTAPALFAPGFAGSLPSGNMSWMIGGHPVWTVRGEVWLWPTPYVGSTGATVVCTNPLTYFLEAPSARTIQVTADLDDGPGGIYLDGALVRTHNGKQTTSIDVPAGKFSLSFIACSNNGGSLTLSVQNRFIDTFGLRVDYARVFNRQ